jgi:hypothetical protein
MELVPEVMLRHAQRENRWGLVDNTGKVKWFRFMAVPAWVKAANDA